MKREFKPQGYRVESAPNGGWIVTSAARRDYEQAVLLGAFSDSADLFEFLMRRHAEWNDTNWKEEQHDTEHD